MNPHDIELPPLPQGYCANEIRPNYARQIFLENQVKDYARAAIEAALQSQPMSTEVTKQPISNETKTRINRNIALIKRLIGNGASKALRDEADVVVSQLERLKEHGTSCPYTLQSQGAEDAERLDWLVENMNTVDIDEGHRGWFVLERGTTRYVVEDCKTYREAIDLARRAEGES